VWQLLLSSSPETVPGEEMKFERKENKYHGIIFRATGKKALAT
jgi:hypothetical protein